MSQELIDMWLHFLTSKDLDNTFINIIWLTQDIYPELMNVNESVECRYVLEMINRHETNPVMRAFFKP